VEFQHKSSVYRQHGTRLVKRSFEGRANRGGRQARWW